MGKGTCGRAAGGGKGQVGTKAHAFGEGRAARGPIGADGNRPLLGTHGRGPHVGTAGGGHVKGGLGVSACNGKGPRWGIAGGDAIGQQGSRDLGGKRSADGTMGGVGKAAATGEDGKGRCAWTRPQTILDGDGYELVQPRRVRADKGTPKGGEEGGKPQHTPTSKGGGDGATTAATARRLWSDDDSDDDAGHLEGDDGGGDWEEEGVAEAPDPRELRTVYEEYARTVRELEKKGNQGPALDTLRQARDEAEDNWRRAKAPAPLPKRMDWAETKLRRAQTALTRARLELDRFDEDTDRRRAELLGRIGEAEAWHQWRKRQLDELHAEAAGKAPGYQGGGPGSEGAAVVREKLRGHVLPEMQAILEEVQEGTRVHERLVLLVAGLAEAEAKLGGQEGGDGPTHYDLYDDDSQDAEWQEDDQPMAVEPECGRQRGEKGGGQRSGGPAAEWRAEGTRWMRASTLDREARQHSPLRPTNEAAATSTTDGRATDQIGGASVTDKDGAQMDTPAYDGNGAAATGGEGTGAEERDEESGERAGKHRRRQSEAESAEEARKAADARRAEELHRQLQIASAAQERSYREGGGGFGSEAALSAAAQKFVLDVQRAQAQAHEMGIEAIAEDGRTLLQLSPAELRQWTDEHLEGE